MANLKYKVVLNSPYKIQQGKKRSTEVPRVSLYSVNRGKTPEVYIPDYVPERKALAIAICNLLNEIHAGS